MAFTVRTIREQVAAHALTGRIYLHSCKQQDELKDYWHGLWCLSIFWPLNLELVQSVFLEGTWRPSKSAKLSNTTGHDTGRLAWGEEHVFWVVLWERKYMEMLNMLQTPISVMHFTLARVKTFLSLKSVIDVSPHIILGLFKAMKKIRPQSHHPPQRCSLALFKGTANDHGWSYSQPITSGADTMVTSVLRQRQSTSKQAFPNTTTLNKASVRAFKGHRISYWKSFGTCALLRHPLEQDCTRSYPLSQASKINSEKPTDKRKLQNQNSPSPMPLLV